MGVGNFGCFNDLLHRGVLYAKADVVEESIVKEDGLLVDVAYQTAKVGHAKLPHIDTIDEDFARRHVVEAGQQINQCALARTALAHNGHRLSATHRQAHTAYHLGQAFAITKAHVAKLYPVLQPLHRCGLLRFLNRIVGIKDFVHAFHTGQPLRNAVGSLREVFQRLNKTIKYDHIEDELRRIDGRAFAFKDQRAAIPQHQHDETRAKKLADGVGRCLTQGHTRRLAPIAVGCPVKALAHLLFGSKGFHYAHTAKGLFKLGHRFAPLLLRRQRLLLQLATYAAHNPHEAWHHKNGKQRQFPTGVNEHAEIAHEEDGVLNEHVEAAHDAVFNLLHIATHARYDVAFALFGKKREGQGRDFAIDAGANIAHNTRTHGHHNTHTGKVARGL